jgi:predicted small lipoprotein YifL
MLRLLLISVACLLAACGQKGPLYLPTAPVVTPPSAVAPATPEESPGNTAPVAPVQP